MKISIFEKGYSLGVDYSEREDCLGVFDIQYHEIKKLEKGAKYEIVKGELKITETEEYLENIKNKIKQEEINEVYKKFNNSLEVINSKYTQVEKDSFEIKRQEAEKVLNDVNYISSFLTGLLIDGETQTELANKIMTNSEAYQTLYATAEQKLRTDLKSIEAKYENNK